VGKNAWAKALTYFNGTAVVPTTEPATTVAPTTPPRHQRAPLVESRPASVPGRRFHVTQAVVSVSRSRYRAGSGHPGPGRGVRRIGRLTSSTASSRSARGHDAVPLGSRHGRGSAGYRPSSSADCAKSVSGTLVLYASTRDEPVNLSDSRPETHQHCSTAGANAATRCYLIQMLRSALTCTNGCSCWSTDEKNSPRIFLTMDALLPTGLGGKLLLLQFDADIVPAMLMNVTCIGHSSAYSTDDDTRSLLTSSHRRRLGPMVLTGWLGPMVDTEPSWCGHPGDLDEPGLRCYQER
jgi:hypothetical protein